MRRLSNTQRAMLVAIQRKGGERAYWDRVDEGAGTSVFGARAVGQTLDSLVRLGLLTRDDDYRLTDAGRAAIDGFTRTVQP